MKTRKTYAAALLAAGILSILGCAPAMADTGGFSEEYYRFQNPDEILSGDEAEQLNELLDEISRNQNFDVTAALVDSLNGESAETYADNLYDDCDFGYGDERDGVLLLVSLEDHDWYISTCGYGITAFTDAGIQYVGGQMLDSLADGDYAQAFRIYAACCDDLIDQARAGHPFDKDDVPRKPMSATVPLICIAIGAALGFATVQGMKAQLKSVHKAGSAANYVRPGSMNLTGKQDLFLYSHVDRVKRETKSSSSSGGGSSTHTSSSGTTHGGGGGKF